MRICDDHHGISTQSREKGGVHGANGRSERPGAALDPSEISSPIPYFICPYSLILIG